jgi:hypothetical protein
MATRARPVEEGGKVPAAAPFVPCVAAEVAARPHNVGMEIFPEEEPIVETD